MSLVQDTPVVVTPHSLQGRVAKAMYLAYHAEDESFTPFLTAPAEDRRRFERAAAAALAVAYREPVTV